MKQFIKNLNLKKTAPIFAILSLPTIYSYYYSTKLDHNRILNLFLRNNHYKLEAKSSNTIEVIDNEYYKSDISKFMSTYYISPVSNKDSFLFLCGENSSHITHEIAKDLNSHLGKIIIKRKGKSSESNIKILENVSNRNVVLINSMGPPVNDNLMEILFTVSALKRSSAKKIIVVIPYFGYSIKADKDSNSNYPLYASMIIKLIEKMGADQIITINLSSKHVTGYSYSIPIIDLDMTCLGVSYYVEKLSKGEMMNNPVIISPHVSSVPRARKFQDMLNANGFEAG